MPFKPEKVWRAMKGGRTFDKAIADCHRVPGAVWDLGRNLAAQRLYQRSGFVTASLQLWYHRWFLR